MGIKQYRVRLLMDEISKVFYKKTSMRRTLFYLVFDILLITISMYGAFYLRFEGIIPEKLIENMEIFILIVLLIKISSMYYVGLYKISWSYVSLKEVLSLVKSISFATFFFGTILFFSKTFPLFTAFPRSILIIDYMLTVFLLGSFRGSKRIYLQYTGRIPKKGERVLIIGAGNTGEQIVRGMLTSEGYFSVGFLDDDLKKIGSTIHGVKVLGKREEMAKFVKEHEVESILIAMPSAPPKVIRETVDIGRTAGIKKLKIIPSLREIISGKVSLASIKEIELEDLLGREQVEIDTETVGSYLDGKTVLVTGASGSIGSELCKQILKFNPKAVIALDQDETGLFWLMRTMEDSRLFPLVGNIRDTCKMDKLFCEFKPHVVFHAAAYKHVPVMEEHPDEALKNNVFGTQIVGETSIKYGTEKFILVSTDKAVNPTSIMGATKRLAEKVIVELNKKNSTKFAAIRFGNVLGSRGSVIPIFKEQIMKGGPVEVTNPEIKRYFMVTSEAVLLILQAGAMAKGGEVFMLDMGEPVKIIDLAREMIRLSGFEPDRDIPIIFTGLRRGEKLYEDLLTVEEGADLTYHKKIFKARLNPKNGRLSEDLHKLKELCEERKSEEIISLMRSMIPTYSPAR
ncbi:polysaccharide biosynthesis protein [Candidatus Pacearchaeota archaeon]|nr:polysaccharide biosynthesis protein [Candidatus Pacearchaeota archaeon]